MQKLDSTEIKALTLWQPWASLIALGLKSYETRSWGTNYRGKLLIHAAKRPMRIEETLPIFYAIGGGGVTTKDFDRLKELIDSNLPYGCIVANADLTDSQEMSKSFIQRQTVLEKSVGNWQPGRFAWKLENVVALTPIPATGKQGLWHPDKQIIERLAVLLGNRNQW